MSVIMAVLTPKGVIVGADTLATTGRGRTNHMRKIYRVGDNYIVGAVGSVGEAVAGLGELRRRGIPENPADVGDALVDFWEHMRTRMQKLQPAYKAPGVMADWLVASPTRIWRLGKGCGIFSCIEQEEPVTVGCGQDLAVGAWEGLDDLDHTPLRRLEMSLEIACKHNSHCGLPLRVLPLWNEDG